jgi:hypothetical protein
MYVSVLVRVRVRVRMRVCVCVCVCVDLFEKSLRYKSPLLNGDDYQLIQRTFIEQVLNAKHYGGNSDKFGFPSCL